MTNLDCTGHFSCQNILFTMPAYCCIILARGRNVVTNYGPKRPQLFWCQRLVQLQYNVKTIFVIDLFRGNSSIL